MRKEQRKDILLNDEGKKEKERTIDEKKKEKKLMICSIVVYIDLNIN